MTKATPAWVRKLEDRLEKLGSVVQMPPIQKALLDVSRDITTRLIDHADKISATGVRIGELAKREDRRELRMKAEIASLRKMLEDEKCSRAAEVARVEGELRAFRSQLVKAVK